MKATEGKIGRVFILRLEDGDIVPGCIEEFCRNKNVLTGQVLLIGGIGGGQVVVGPRVSEAIIPEPMILPVDDAHEVVGVGIIAPDGSGQPVMHIHAALGRSGKTTTGCLRPGVTTWLVGEAIISEILGADAIRKPDPASGLVLLEVDS